jgi:hypothetical protein
VFAALPDTTVRSVIRPAKQAIPISRHRVLFVRD